jgi:hypothetical protein
MKIKRFNNLWAMGLILFGALLVAFYVIKIICPEFIIGIAETPRIVEFGTIIQNNIVYLCLFNILSGYLYGYLYCCACCRTYILNLKSNIILLSSNIILVIIMILLPEHYNTINYISFITTPFLICLVNKTLNKETFISTTVCFSLDLIIQILSLLVRNLALLTTKGNVVTFLILLIDGFIWRIIFYLFFNYKNKIKEI